MINNRIEQLKELSLLEWRIMLVAMVLLPLVALSFQLVEFKKTRKFLKIFIHGESGLKKHSDSYIEKAFIIAKMVGVAARHGAYSADCLQQSLVIWWLLARHGISSDIRFGVHKGQVNEIGAHAWVECGNVNLTDTAEVQQRFLKLEDIKIPGRDFVVK